MHTSGGDGCHDAFEVPGQDRIGRHRYPLEDGSYLRHRASVVEVSYVRGDVERSLDRIPLSNGQPSVPSLETGLPAGCRKQLVKGSRFVFADIDPWREGTTGHLLKADHAGGFPSEPDHRPVRRGRQLVQTPGLRPDDDMEGLSDEFASLSKPLQEAINISPPAWEADAR